MGDTNATGGDGSVTIDWVECAPPRTLVIDIPQTFVEGTLGSEHVLGSIDVPSDLRGIDCFADLFAFNNESLREGTDLIVRSGSAEVGARNVEHEVGDVHVGGTILLSDTLEVIVVLGEYLDHGAFSGGARAVVTCGNPAPSNAVAVSPDVITNPPAAMGGIDAVSVATVVAVSPRYTG